MNDRGQCLCAAGLVAACAWLCACASAPPFYVNSCNDYDTPRTNPNANRITSDQIKAQTHQLFAALDRADAATFATELGDTFSLIGSGFVRDRAFLLDSIQQRAARKAPKRTRSWQNEHIRISDDAAIFIGESIVHEPGDAEHPAADFAGLNTLVFAPERGSFRAMSWQWVPSGRGEPERNECDPLQ